MRKPLMKFVVRRLLKPVMSHRVPVPFQRRWLEGLSVATWMPDNVLRFQHQVAGVAVETLRPTRCSAKVILFCHGGAYIVGSPRTHRGLTSRLAKVCGAQVLVPDYRLAPEHPFPAAIDDIQAIYQGLLDQGHAPENIVIAGDSAGGGLALATALRLRDQKLPMPAALVLLSPWVDLRPRKPPAVADLMLDSRWSNMAAKAYLRQVDPQHPLASPLFADLRGLPPVLIQVGTAETLHHEAQRLHQAFVAAEQDGRFAERKAQLQEYDGMWHVFQLHAGQLPEADRALAAIACFVEENTGVTPMQKQAS